MAKKKAKTTKPTFEQSLAELEMIVGEMEGGELGLAEALAQYELGVKHLKACYELLQRAERRIEIISGIDANGNPIAVPFDEDEEADLKTKAATRGRKRSARSHQVDDSGTLF